ncbi:protein of unassigned function [Methylobacterium oryzae CBMB20]|uniref:Protein of unassigned function n=1 Tax=Methylobacterium oryzae CBMB20 TaxID=693986 RepID=A0A089NSL6_9HYPH|nr:protein of unassigned function [Methylobacterium oryzae CBMB20]
MVEGPRRGHEPCACATARHPRSIAGSGTVGEALRSLANRRGRAWA